MQYRGFLHFLFLILWFIWEEGCLISGRRSRKAWSLMRQPLQTVDKPHPSVCPGHAQSRRDSLMRWAQWADVKKIVIFKKITSAAFKSVSKFVEIQSRLTFSCKSWKNVSQIIDFADIFPDFLYFLHFWGITHHSKFQFMEIRWQNFKNKQILSAQEDLLLLTPATYEKKK